MQLDADTNTLPGKISKRALIPAMDRVSELLTIGAGDHLAAGAQDDRQSTSIRVDAIDLDAAWIGIDRRVSHGRLLSCVTSGEPAILAWVASPKARETQSHMARFEVISIAYQLLRNVGPLGVLILRSIRNGYDDNILQWAASIAFFAFLSFTPLMFVSISIASFFFDAAWVADQIHGLLDQFLPNESDQQVGEFIDNAVAARGRIGLLSFIAFLYTGTRVFAVLTRALHIVYEVEPDQHFVRELIVQIVMLFTVGIAIATVLTSDLFFDLVSSVFWFLPHNEGSPARKLISALLQLAVLIIGLSLIYRYIPRNASTWRPALTGAVTATILLALIRPGFTFYLRRFSEQNIIYGSLSSIIILLIWIWIGAIIVLFCGELAANLQSSRRSL